MKRHATLNPAGVSHVHRPDGGSAFVPDPSESHARTDDDLAEALAESYVAAAISGESQADEALNDFVVEELGGPFVQDDGAVDLPPEGFPRLAGPLRRDLATDPDLVGPEPPSARRSESPPRPQRASEPPQKHR
jgi:hypothetical protein